MIKEMEMAKWQPVGFKDAGRLLEAANLLAEFAHSLGASRPRCTLSVADLLAEV